MDTGSQPPVTEARSRLNFDTGFRRVAALAFSAVGGFVFLGGLFDGWFWGPLFEGLFMGGLAYALVRGIGWAVDGFLNEA
jgi:hypothetical protein